MKSAYALLFAVLGCSVVAVSGCSKKETPAPVVVEQKPKPEEVRAEPEPVRQPPPAKPAPPPLHWLSGAATVVLLGSPIGQTPLSLVSAIVPGPVGPSRTIPGPTRTIPGAPRSVPGGKGRPPIMVPGPPIVVPGTPVVLPGTRKSPWWW
jgi:hypothetical protein